MKKLNETKRVLLIGCIALVLAVVGSSIFSIPGFAAERSLRTKTNGPTTYPIYAPGGGDPVPGPPGGSPNPAGTSDGGGGGMSLLRSSRRSPRSFISWCFRRGRYRRRFLISSINPWSPPGNGRCSRRLNGLSRSGIYFPPRLREHTTM